MKIEQHTIGQGQKTFVIAEIGQAHDGSLGQAHAFIDAVAEVGADAIKFQTHIAAAESTRDETFRIPMSGQDESRFAYWKRMEFTEEQWLKLAHHARDKGLVFLSSAFSLAAVELLKKIGMPAWKVGSGEFRSQELLQAMIEKGAPILFSTGMSSYDEVDQAVQTFKKANVEFALFQCTSKYPTPMEDVGLNVLEEYREKYGCSVGLSDHSGSVHPAITAISRNVDLLELHVVFDKRMYGPDTVASVTMDELKFICDHARAVNTMNKNLVNKDEMAENLSKMRELFTKSIALVTSQKAGTILSEDMLTPKKPGTGIPYTNKSEVIGKTLANDVDSERLLTREDLAS
nr:N-acetylneuraminate synthase [Cytophagales bacterium]